MFFEFTSNEMGEKSSRGEIFSKERYRRELSGFMGGCSNPRKEISAKVQSWSVEGLLGTKPMQWGWGWQLTEGLVHKLEGLPLGRKYVGQWQKLLRLWLLRCVKKARIHPLKAATLLVPCTPLPSSSQVGLIRNSLAVFLHSLRTLLRVPSSAFLASPAGSPCSFSNTELYPYPCFWFCFF